MDVDEFLERSAGSGLRLPAANMDSILSRPPEQVDGLFHLPLLALAVMVIARQAPFRTVALGRSVALLLIEHFSVLRSASHELESSLTLRRRCADALAFLEASGLVAVSAGVRLVTLTANGKANLDNSMKDETDLGFLARQLQRSQQRAATRAGNQDES